MARKLKWGMLGIVALMIFAFQYAGVKIEPPVLEDKGDAGPATDAIQAAQQAIRAEPKVKDFIYQQGQAVEWQVGVLDDGTNRVGFANYICEVLGEHRALTPRTQVRIVDIAKVSRGESFRSASLGHVACADRRVIVP